MTTTPYTLYHGTSNDFAVVDAANHVPDRAAFAQRVCADLGVDGVLFLALQDEYEPPRCVMTLVQPDGSTAAMCGNGARCAARWVTEQTGESEVMLDTQAGTRRSTVDGAHVVVEMGVPDFAPDAVPVRGDAPMDGDVLNGYAITAVNTGVPHAVTFVEDVDAVDVEGDAPPVRSHERFPAGANVTFAEETEWGFAQRTFERGVEGETQSCGTGAVAVAAVAARHGRVPGDATVTVAPPGGELEVSLTPGGRATLAGPTERVRDGEAETEPRVPKR
ncbi:diaminopimelate epimerase [Halocalculus aciditolerans]|uniref:Diaminopimelate epimerase n=1 Tax=Halocalculus aciditolerans TaxID=1383812 RepID=A0A830FD06_9EURY|nr:diaminopimelate epimerase [Halocalculus aciditolerans]GGL62893.1 diaminopimelate epimerase [Halocalculus aciditolerans]